MVRDRGLVCAAEEGRACEGSSARDGGGAGTAEEKVKKGVLGGGDRVSADLCHRHRPVHAGHSEDAGESPLRSAEEQHNAGTSFPGAPLRRAGRRQARGDTETL